MMDVWGEGVITNTVELKQGYIMHKAILQPGPLLVVLWVFSLVLAIITILQGSRERLLVFDPSCEQKSPQNSRKP